MRSFAVPFEPYHPHLGYTLLVTLLAWVAALLAGRYALKDQPALRVKLYALALGMPIYAELGSLVIYYLRPSHTTSLGAFLSHLHITFVQPLPLDTYLPHGTYRVVMLLLALCAVVALLRLWAGAYWLRRLFVAARPLEQTAYAPLLLELELIARRHHLRVPAIVVGAAPTPVACTAGLLRPRIYLSTALLEVLNDEQALAVICHEWAHLERRDNLWNLLHRFLHDLLFLLPGTHPCWRALMSSQEQACDAFAIQLTGRPFALARALVTVASHQLAMPRLRQGLPISTFHADSTGLQARVEALVRRSDNALSSAYLCTLATRLLAAFLVVTALLPVLLGS